MKSERDNFKRRLGKAEQDLVEAKEQCITLTTNMQQLEREVSKLRLGFTICTIQSDAQSKINTIYMKLLWSF